MSSSTDPGQSGTGMANIPPTLMVLLIIGATAVGVLLAWAMFNGYAKRNSEESSASLDTHQAVYMREVRMRNLDAIEDMTRHLGPSARVMEYV